MSTRSFVVVKTEKGYDYIYVHWDGSTLGEQLTGFWNSREKAEYLIQLGNLSYIEESTYKQYHEKHASVPNERVLEKDAYNNGIEYLYLFDTKWTQYKL